MTTITQNRIASLDPSWAPFSGFSILFDNPGDAYVRTGSFSHISCSPMTDGPLDFYARLSATLNELATEEFIRTCHFCPLPPSSFHVTAWDGINDDNIGLVNSEIKEDWLDFLIKLPASLAAPPESMSVINGSGLRNWPKSVSFKFRNLVLWGNQVLAAELAPADKVSERQLIDLIESRNVLNEEAEKVLGIRSSETYSPHVSLGYFANMEGAKIASPQVSDWSDRFLKDTGNSRITFGSVDIYGFTDMTSFFKTS